MDARAFARTLPGMSRMRLELAVVLFAGVALVGCVSGRAVVSGERAARADVARYTLTLLEDGSGWQVEAELPPRLSKASLCAPALGTRRGESLEWLGVEADGEAAALAWDARGCFVAPRFAGHLRLRYRARVEPARAPAWRAISLSPHAEPALAGVVFPGESLFIDVEDALLTRLVAARVEVEVLPGLVLATTLSEATAPADSGRRVFEAADIKALQRSVVWAAPALERVARDGLAVTLSPRLTELDPEALHARAQCLAAQLDGWVSSAPVAPGELLVLHAGWDQAARSGLALAGGAVLQVGPATARDAKALDSLLAHELFHRYNGGAGLQYLDSEHDATTWFREGATSYVAALSLVHAGLAGEAEFVSLLEGHARGYLANPARSATDERRAPATALERLSYDRGVLLSLALDLLLRDVSGGRRSLRGFFQYLSRSSWWQQPMTNRALQSALEGYAGVPLESFFEPYVLREAPIPVATLLRQAGFGVVAAEREVADPGMSLEYDVENAWLEVREVAARGAAQAAGVQVGDVIEPVATTRLGALESPEGPLEFELVRGASRSFVRLQPSRRVVPSLVLEPGTAQDAPWRVLLEGVSAASACEAEAGAD